MKRKASQRQTRHALDKSGPMKGMLQQLCPLVEDAELVDLDAWQDRQGNLRRARGRYDNGWSIDIFFTLPKAGKVKMSSWRLNWHGTVKGGIVPAVSC